MTPVLARRLGNDRAFERLYRKHAGDVYRYALVVLRNQADAEDVTQTTFLNAYRAFEKGERPQKPQNWLIAIAHNVCRQRFRQAQRRPTEVGYEDELAETVVEDDALSAEDLRRALGHLAFNQRSALVMRELEGRSYAEIAEILGVSVSAVETLLFRARRALREQLEQSITCQEAELSISRQLDGRLPRKEKGALRAHLRECDDCASFARSQRASRGALKALGAIPLPGSLAGLFGGGGAAVGGGFAIKAAALAAGALVATGVGYEGVKREVLRKPHPAAAAAPIAQLRANRAKPTPSAAATARLATHEAKTDAKTDEKPFRPAAVRARKAHPVHPVTPAVTSTPAATKAKPGTSARERAHDLKPFKPAPAPAHAKKPNPGLGHAKQTPKPAAPPKAKGPTQRHTGATGPSGPSGPSGHNQGKAKSQTPAPATDAAAHGKSGR